MNVSRRRATFYTLSGSAINTLFVSIQAVVLIPLFLNAIGPRLYGAWLGSGDILVWLQAFDLGLPNLMIQRIGAAHGRGDKQTVAEYFAAGMLALAGLACISAAIAFMLSSFLPIWMGLFGAEAEELRWCFVVASMATAVNIFNISIIGFSRGVQKTAFMNGTTILSSILGFAVSLGLILAGQGLWAIAWGLVARASVSLMGSAIFAAVNLRGGMFHFFRVRPIVLREFMTILPSTALGGFSYAVMNQSESALVAIFAKPELAAVFTLTRKAIEAARALVDMVGAASYGSFAHLITSDQRHRALQIYTEITSLWLSVAIVMASAYMAVNSSLVSIWVGSSQYGGTMLTILMAVQSVVVGGSYLMNYLYRATGSIMQGSLALLAESVVRVPLMIGLMSWLGLPGVPMAGILTAGISGWLAYRWTLKDLSGFADTASAAPLRVWAMRLIIFCVGMLICFFVRREEWGFVLALGLTVVVVGGISLVLLDPLLHNIYDCLIAVLDRLRLSRPRGNQS